MHGTAEALQMYEKESFQKVRDAGCVHQSVRVVQAPFTAIQYMNSAKYLPEDTTLEIERLMVLREKNVHFWKADILNPRSTFIAIALLLFKRHVKSGRERAATEIQE